MKKYLPFIWKISLFLLRLSGSVLMVCLRVGIFVVGALFFITLSMLSNLHPEEQYPDWDPPIKT